MEAVRTGDTADLAMEHLGRLSTENISNFCGRCHGDVAGNAAVGLTGTATVKDRRISRVACHDPHKALDTRAAAYDSKCQACHQAGGKKLQGGDSTIA